MIKSKYLIIISLIITITLCVIGFSYSFYVAGITGNEEASSLIATTGYLRLVYTDTMYVRGDKITPGWTQTKTFTVENTGDYLAQYDLIWETLNNTLINKDTLTYTITSNNGGGNIQNVVIPDSGSDLSIVNDIKIYPGVIQTYTAVFRYENASFDQSSDMDKVFNGKLAIRSNKLVYDYNYTGDVQIFTSPKTAKYKIQLWGAQGGGGFGYGGYTEGEILLKSGTQLFVYVGQYPEYATGSCYATNPNTSFNGNSTGTCASGGGATDIRLIGGKWHDLTSLKSRIMVSGAGGGTIYGGSGGPAGGLISYDGIGTEGAAGYSVGIGVNQTTGASFGIPSRSTTSGGGGYYGGNGAFGGNSAGGSSYISGHTGCVAIASNQTTDPKTGCLTGTADNSCSVHYSTYYFTNTKMIDGKGYSWTNEIGNIEQMPNPSGGLFDSGTGNTGNGHARITYLEDVSASDYNNDHLILLYDGLENNGYQQHANNVSTWKDLTGNNNDGVLTNFPANLQTNNQSGWHDDGLKFDGSDDTVLSSVSGTNFSQFKKNTSFSYCVTFTTGATNVGAGQWHEVITNMASWGNGGFNIQYGITQGIALGYGEYLHANIYPALASTYNVCGVYDGTVMKIYLDGILKNNSTYNITAGTSQLYLARFYTGLLPMNGVIHNVLFYNKALNDNEVYYNYSINKVRYMP